MAINNTHIQERIREHIAKMERGEEVEAKKDKTLLSNEWQQALEDAWALQQDLRAIHKPPKTQEKKELLGWKTKMEVRLDIYKQALVELEHNVVDDIRELQRQRELKAAKVFMSAWSEALGEGKSGASAQSAGNIAMTRAGFTPQGSIGLTRRDREIQKMEEDLLKQFESELSDEEKEQLEILREHEKSVEKPGK